jgi:hypothetical protein
MKFEPSLQGIGSNKIVEDGLEGFFIFQWHSSKYFCPYACSEG